MSNKKLTLTIVIPAYNEEGYLKACLDSIASQTVLPDEVIIVDNNSTDFTVEIAKNYSFGSILREKTQGVFFASRTGFAAARSDIIARIDADTILPKSWVKTVKNSFTGEAAAVTGPVYYYDMPLAKKNFWFDHVMRKMTYKWAKHTPFLYGSNMAVLKKDWRNISSSLCADRDIHEDIDVAVHLKLAGRKIIYDKKFISGASGRRYNDNLHSFSGYISMYKRTFDKHDLHSWAIYPAIFMWFLGYILIHPLRNAWYVFYLMFNPSYPVKSDARKNPMSS